MKPAPFDQANALIRTAIMRADYPCFRGEVARGRFEGTNILVLAWRPEPADLERLTAGGTLYITFPGVDMHHHISTSFAEATLQEQPKIG